MTSKKELQNIVQECYYRIQNHEPSLQWSSDIIPESEMEYAKYVLKKKGQWVVVEINKLDRYYDEVVERIEYNIVMIGPNNKVYQIDFNYQDEPRWVKIYLN